MVRSDRNGLVLLFGLLLGLLAWLALLGGASLRGRPVPWFSIWYNVPITTAFGAMTLQLAASILRLPPSTFLARHLGILLAWLLGGLLLWFRLVAKSIDVSGHMAWAILLGVQCHVLRLPIWFTILVWGVAAQVLVLKLLVLGGSSGQSGLLVGVVLGGTLWVVNRLSDRQKARVSA